MNDTNQHIQSAATWLYEEYHLFYEEFLKILDLAKLAFEKRDFASSIRVSSRRLSLYSISIAEVGNRLKLSYPQIHSDIDQWWEVEYHYQGLIRGEYDEDIARAYLHSLRRKIYQGEWRPTDYSFTELISGPGELSAQIVKSITLDGSLTKPVVLEILKIPEFIRSYADIHKDTERVAIRVAENLSRPPRNAQRLICVEMINTGFYRNRGAYLVGRLVFEDGRLAPLIIALLNDESGIYVDAVLTSETYAHNIFSSTLANFHVTSSYYHEVSAVLKSIMPRRPLGLHYSTIGYNHLGK